MPEFKGKIINSNKRYLRFTNGAHPSWLGYKDRHLFPPFELEPSFFFIRKLNSLGDIFQEQKLISWIQDYHFNETDEVKICTIEMMSVRIDCLKEFADEIAFKGSVIIIPVNMPYITIANNLVCSLNLLGMKNIVYWALDLEVYEMLLQKGELVILLPGLNPIPDLLPSKSEALQNVLRSKPVLIEMILKAGLSVWMIDADMVVLKDFRNILEPRTDVFISDESGSTVRGGVKAVASSSLMYFRANDRTLKLIGIIRQILLFSCKMDDEIAFRSVIEQSELVSLFPANHSSTYSHTGEPSKLLSSQDHHIHVRYFDSLRFISSKVFIDQFELIPFGFNDYYSIHFHGTSTKSLLEKHHKWFLNEESFCII